MFIYKVLYTFTCFVCIQVLIKSDSVIKAIDSALYDLDNIETGEIPDHLKDAHYAGAKKLGRGVEYKYPHNYQNNYEYAKDIEFEDTINAVKTISEIVTPIEV